MFEFLEGIVPASLSAVFAYGLFTGVHCVGMCGGFALSGGIASRKRGKRGAIESCAAYNLGRLISYTVAGTTVGGVGRLVSIAGPARGVLPLIGGTLVVLMGLNALGVLKLFRIDFSLLTTSRLENIARNMFLLGLVSALFPCGPLQAMLLYCLSSADAVRGGLAMLVFTAGTIPALLGFGILDGLLSVRFTRDVGRVSAVILIALGLAMAGRGLALLGVKPELPSFSGSPDVPIEATLRGKIQLVFVDFDPRAYPPIVLKKGIPVRWIIRMNKKYLGACAANIEIPAFAVREQLSPGDTVIEFTPDSEGVFPYTSWCGMISNTITVKSES